MLIHPGESSSELWVGGKGCLVAVRIKEVEGIQKVVAVAPVSGWWKVRLIEEPSYV